MYFIGTASIFVDDVATASMVLEWLKKLAESDIYKFDLVQHNTSKISLSSLHWKTRIVPSITIGKILTYSPFALLYLLYLLKLNYISLAFHLEALARK